MPLNTQAVILLLACVASIRAQLRDAIIIESTNAQNTMQAKRVMFGFLNDCSNPFSAAASDFDASFSNSNSNGDFNSLPTNSNTNSSLVLDVYKRLAKLEKQLLALQSTVTQLTAVVNACNCSGGVPVQSLNQSSPKVNARNVTNVNISINVNINEKMSQRMARDDWNSSRSPADRYADYKHIADMKPVFWLSAHYFDGFKLTNASVRTGVVRRQTDVVDNDVLQLGTVSVFNDNGYSAYAFNKNNSITSTTYVDNRFTLITAFRYPSYFDGCQGHFFTTTLVDNLFAGHFRYTQRWYMENNWVSQIEEKASGTEILIGTSDNGVKNLWTHDLYLIANSRNGSSTWGSTIIGRPTVQPQCAATVNVYEAMVFDKVLNKEQRQYVAKTFSKWYNV